MEEEVLSGAWPSTRWALSALEAERARLAVPVTTESPSRRGPSESPRRRQRTSSRHPRPSGTCRNASGRTPGESGSPSPSYAGSSASWPADKRPRRDLLDRARQMSSKLAGGSMPLPRANPEAMGNRLNLAHQLSSPGRHATTAPELPYRLITQLAGKRWVTEVPVSRAHCQRPRGTGPNPLRWLRGVNRAGRVENRIANPVPQAPKSLGRSADRSGERHRPGTECPSLCSAKHGVKHAVHRVCVISPISLAGSQRCQPARSCVIVFSLSQAARRGEAGLPPSSPGESARGSAGVSSPWSSASPSHGER